MNDKIINDLKFKEVILKVAGEKIEKNKIGLLSEKAMHSIIKNYLADECYHEQKIGSFYADIFVDNQVIEIQTANFNKLREKLNFFLNEKSVNVTVVYPIPFKKTIYWIDPEDNKIINSRLSNRRGSFTSCFKELYKIKQFLKNENLQFKLMLINCDEYKYLDGWDKTKKRGSSRLERIPTELVDVLDLENKNDYLYFTKDFDGEFTSKEFKLKHKVLLKDASVALNLLNHIGIIERVGKKGRSFIYKNVVEEK